MTGPSVPISQEIHAQKYRSEGEDFRAAMSRVASAMRDDDRHYHQFRDIIMEMRFLPAGRIQAAMGAAKSVTPYNCYVSGTIDDSFVEGSGAIMQRATEAAATMRMGGGIGYDFSTLRPRGAMIKKLHSQSSGPISFMHIFDAVCRCVASSGHRRGAQMGVMRVDHPDILEFVRAKRNVGELTGFNISVAVTDDFMRALQSGGDYYLRHGDQIHGEASAAEVWETIMRSTWDWAEPGVLFIDTINKMNNLWYCEQIAATNPCGEQPLPPHGACLLGSFNLTRYLTQVTNADQRVSWDIDLDQLREDIPAVVRAMDNVVDRARYPLREQELEAQSKRRMGLGVTGLANTLEAMGHPYGSEGFVRMEERILDTIKTEAYRASAILAEEKGSFPLYDEDRYMEGQFIQTLDAETQDMIRAHGIRNSHLTSIAPTGTISLAADNVSSSIEPVFAHSYERDVIEFSGTRTETVHDYGVKFLGVRGRRSQEVTLDEHLAVLAAAQRHTDSAVSKTLNVGDSVGWDEFCSVYTRAWEMGCKGCTTFRAAGLREGVLREEAQEGATCEIVNGVRSCE